MFVNWPLNPHPRLQHRLRSRCTLTTACSFKQRRDPCSGPLIELPEMRLEFPFNLIGQSSSTFLTGKSWLFRESWYTAEGNNKDFGSGYCSITRNEFKRASKYHLSHSHLELGIFSELSGVRFLILPNQIACIGE